MPEKKEIHNLEIRVTNMGKVVRELEKKYKKSSSSYKREGGHFWIFGSALAIILSYTQNSSILWAILHGILSWLYVLFRAMQIWGWF